MAHRPRSRNSDVHDQEWHCRSVQERRLGRFLRRMPSGVKREKVIDTQREKEARERREAILAAIATFATTAVIE